MSVHSFPFVLRSLWNPQRSVLLRGANEQRLTTSDCPFAND